MSKTHLNLGILLSGILLMSAGAGAQTTEPVASKVTFEQLTKSARVYFRDTAELPMTQKLTFSVFDSSGHIRKTKKQLLESMFNGYNTGSHRASGKTHGNVSLWAEMRGAKMLKASMNSMFWAMIAGVTLYSKPAELYVLEMKEKGDTPSALTAKLTPVKPCSAVTITRNKDVYFPDAACGTIEYNLNDDLSFQKFTFAAQGVPAPVRIDPLGDSTLQGYRAEVEFQKITIPGDKEPYLVPKQVTATLETNKGKIVISSVYEVKQRTGNRE